MANINIVTSSLSSSKFTGGILCILEYAHQLTLKKHNVRIIPILPSNEPLWFIKPYGEVVRIGRKNLFSSGLLNGIALLPKLGKIQSNAKLREEFGESARKVLLSFDKILPYEIRRGLSLSYFKDVFQSAHATIATSYDTALPVHLHGNGKKFYFMQHYEPFFKNETSNPLIAEKEAELSYHLGLDLIANSSWLREKISTLTHKKVELCNNAIDHSIFHSIGRNTARNNEIRLISYGGRNAEWKGFRNMAAAVKIARNKLNTINIIWNVYGDALLPPDNSVAPYNHLGFLNSVNLAKAYNEADILLSASWYESFPLFPIEAMACGLAVITSQLGTEDFAISGETAEVIDPHNPESIAAGIIKLVTDKNYRDKISEAGNRKSKLFNWEKSGANLERIILA